MSEINTSEEWTARLTTRAQDPARAVDEGQSRTAARATAAQIADAEASLKFTLPSLLKEVYTEIGDGGWGPGGGLPPLADLPKAYRARRQDNGGRSWPERLLPICDWGGGIVSCLDCATDGVRVIRLDPNMPKADEAMRLPAARQYDNAGRVKEACWVENESLAGWMEAWADGQPLFYLAYRGDEEDDEQEDEDEEDAE